MSSVQPTDQPTGHPNRRLVLVTGAGRSGTSTVAGALHLLGLHVPLPVLKANRSNPMGFYESTWPLRFHRRIMDRAFVEQTDGRPEAEQLMAKAITPEIRQELRAWLARVAGEAPQAVVKDPRSSWLPRLWAETAAELDIDLGFLTMIRHPAEVLGSRATYYRQNRPDMDDWQFSVMNLCGWINGNLAVERQTRGGKRAVIGYHELIADWRSAMSSVRDTLGLTFNDDLRPDHTHAVDQFVDSSLRRHTPDWGDMDMPPPLVEIAEGIFVAMSRLAAHGGRDRGAQADLDALGAQYATVMRTAQAIAKDTTLSASKAAAARVAAERPAAGRRRWRSRVSAVRERFSSRPRGA